MNTINNPENKSWLATHLYYTEPWEDFLVDAVKPIVDEIMSSGLAEQFFFIRYWEKGPHIRLRFKGNTHQLESEVKPQLIRHFTAYFTVNPSKRSEPEWAKGLSDDLKWFPNNSIQFIDYEPEIERYGGDAGILIAEKQFQASSRAVLGILEEGNWNYSRALGVANQLHLGFAHALGMDVNASSEFFDQQFAGWFPRAYATYIVNDKLEEVKEIQAEVLQAFRKSFEIQKEALLTNFKVIWEALESECEFEQKWFNQWLKDMREIFEDLKKAQKQNELTIPLDGPTHNSAGIFWPILSSYIHMTNNRLGILNRDEGYLGYLIKESLNELSLIY